MSLADILSFNDHAILKWSKEVQVVDSIETFELKLV